MFFGTQGIFALTCVVLVSSNAVCCVIRLFLEKLPKHPTYKNASKDDKLNTKKVM